MKGASSTHQDEVLAEEQKTYTLSYIYIYIIRVSSLLNVCRHVVLIHTLILLIIVDCHNYLHEHSNSSSMKFGNFVFY